MKINTETAVLGGGCFWCTEALFRRLRGVISVVPGYAGGTTKNPSYDDVCMGGTGHAEVIKVEFNPDIIPYRDLLDIFIHTHDPTTVNRQGADTGTEYRSIILTSSEDQNKIAKELIHELKESKEFTHPIVTEIKPLEAFYEAEESQKEYYEKNSYMPYCQIVISPKIAHLKEKYSRNLA
jgi:peptide-methionine (S)-S-oxide reductase